MRENGKMKGAYAVKRNWIYLLAVCLGAGILIGFLSLIHILVRGE